MKLSSAANYRWRFMGLHLFFSDVRFILGILLYILGYITNRWADYRLRALRETKGEDGKHGLL